MRLSYGTQLRVRIPELIRSSRICRDVLAGRYCSGAKQALEANPDFGCSWYSPLLRCRCGIYSSEDAELRKKRYPVSFRYGLCGRRMRELEELPDDPLVCPRCGLLWD